MFDVLIGSFGQTNDSSFEGCWIQKELFYILQRAIGILLHLIFIDEYIQIIVWNLGTVEII